MACQKLDLAMALGEGAGWLVNGHLYVYVDVLFLNVKGKEMVVSLLVCYQGPQAGVPIATLWLRACSGTKMSCDEDFWLVSF